MDETIKTEFAENMREVIEDTDYAVFEEEPMQHMEVSMNSKTCHFLRLPGKLLFIS